MLNQAETGRLAHLLRRAGFGSRPDEWTAYAKLGVAGTTDRLLHPETVPDHLAEVMHDIGGDYIDFNSLDSLSKWWLYRMLHTQRPLEEKMTLFWHGHFATANYKVDNPKWMWQQNQTLRTHALGNFRSLLQAITRDPAMLVWLDGTDNRKGHPNENYGRELQELFTMGVGSGYTEKDVQEAARAFTGWQVDREAGSAVFRPERHDDGVKTFLGETGNFGGDDIIDIIVRQPATATFLCAKLFRFFVHDDPTPADLKPLTEAYFGSGYEIRAVVGAILKSPAFYSPQAMYAQIKSPTEYVVTLMRTLDAPMSAAEGSFDRVKEMGQELFNPPNVKGWPGGQTWMNTMTLLARVSFASRVISNLGRQGTFSDKVHAVLSAHGAGAGGLGTPDQIADAVWSAFLPGHAPSAKTRAALIAYVQDKNAPGRAHFESKAPGLMTLILSAPEYHLA
ncbi:MAG: DUF1800 domain-containing protein [Armatimonadetes bacterium]|nr:DUF1800 domain-containing protein [Armatimonadota bacterium]